MKYFLSIILVALILALRLDAQLVPPTPEDYDAVLIPLAPREVVGAYGSRWSYEFVALNSGTETLIGYFNNRVPEPVPPPDIFPAWTGCVFPACPPDVRLPPGSVFPHLLGDDEAYGHLGLMLYVRKAASPSFQFQLRVKDVSRSELAAGVELSPIPVRQLVRGAIHLLNVPSDPRFRLTLRVYDPSPLPDNSARIKVINQGTGEIVHEATYPLRQPQNPWKEMYPGFPRHPDFLQLSDFPTTGPLAFYGVRIEVESLTGRPIWAFVSITNNETQEVTMVTPYRGD